MHNKTVSILGATGSVGSQACSVVKEGGFEVEMLSAGKNAERMAEFALQLHPKACVMEDEAAAAKLRSLLDGENIAVYSGALSLTEYLLEYPADVTVHAIAGLAGLDSALAAAKTGTRLAMANKEAVIAAGSLIKSHLDDSGGSIIPVDSEHSAIFQCLTTEGEPGLFCENKKISRIFLTASGGPFFGMKRDELLSVTPEMALAHPTWKMGPKITVDCATLMNKGFEVIEASRFFGVPADRVEVVIHRQSIIHSMVEYIDNAVIAQMGMPDMRSAVRYAVYYPERTVSKGEKVDFSSIGSLTFSEPDRETFPLLDAAVKALERGGTAPASLIAADEEAVEAFLKGKISFCGISDVVLEIMERAETADEIDAESIAAAVEHTRNKATEIIEKAIHT